jgi:hypothetical protein
MWREILKITKWGHFKDSKWSLAQNLDFSGALDLKLSILLKIWRSKLKFVNL